MSAAAPPHMPAHGPPTGHQPPAMPGYQQGQQVLPQPTEGRMGHYAYRHLHTHWQSAIHSFAMYQHPQVALPPVLPQRRYHDSIANPFSPPMSPAAVRDLASPGVPGADLDFSSWGARDTNVAHADVPGPYSGSMRYNGTYLKPSLHVEQQPDRARMCGFGDKDRRPITPPICVRLTITDTNTGREVEVNEISSEFFVLQVDLFDVSGHQEVNLVRHSSASPSMSISMASVAAYPPAPEAPYARYQPPYNMYGGYEMPQQNQYSFNPQGYWQPHPGTLPPVQQAANNNFTRNLIGSTNVSAAQLADTSGKVGFWFVLQDLSVRQEGTFRLKMSFFDLMSASEPGKLAGHAGVLATVYSDSFQVHSAKRFPGVKESTSLSKCFASQGVKIPIRKDGANKSANGDDLDD